MLKTHTLLTGKRPFLFMLICLWAVSLACRFEKVRPPFAAQESSEETAGETAVSPTKQPKQTPPVEVWQGASMRVLALRELATYTAIKSKNRGGTRDTYRTAENTKS